MPVLADWTTFRVGGPALEMAEVDDLETLLSLLSGADDRREPVLLLGGGSNVLISDGGFPGMAVRIALKGWTTEVIGDEVVVSVAAGEPWAPFVDWSVEEGLAGLECLTGIPGLVGAAPVQNVGAYGQDARQTIEKVSVWDRTLRQLRDMPADQCKFAYRHSIFKRNARYVVTNVTFRLRRSRLSGPLRYGELARCLGRSLGERASLLDTARAVMDLRRSKGMVIDAADPDSRSAGSFFVNPVLAGSQLSVFQEAAPGAPHYSASGGQRVPAAWLVEHSGFQRGYRRGGAAISSKHALALIALDGGSASDVLALAREVREGVRATFGVTLEPEPVLVGLHL